MNCELKREFDLSVSAYGVTRPLDYQVVILPWGATEPHNLHLPYLTNATLRYAIALADKGWQQACRDDESLRRGLNIVDGRITYKAVADAFNLPYSPIEL